MPDQIAQLFAEYADAYARGERPQADEYLARAGGDAEELADLLEHFVQATPAREPDAETLALTEAWLTGEPPLVGLRASRGVRVDEVVDALVMMLGLDPTKRAKVKRYYQRLEQGFLEPGRVSARVWAVVGDLVGAEAAQHTGWQPPQTVLSDAYFRADEPLLAPTPPAQGAAEQADEIDALFLGEGD